MSKPKNRLKELLYELIEGSPSRYNRKRFYGFLNAQVRLCMIQRRYTPRMPSNL
ncbi:hypothetical protein LEP1GSC133_1255 [Leptospira borgpetersenii serovar Pomona str. 200901868]|uniref:Uncharacterized protein n=1 Tax=Leptospira borgpetersenii serovar Pomona str. 200901868 TaxID=1192866 RepID=M6WS00_LEPBO|nr:hypothetical protein LEP1GSC133_1255 [Leptospira borgpetersenii serovar Pomona str. 200901868]